MEPQSGLMLRPTGAGRRADNYQPPWTATQLGVNYFWNGHNVKVQLTYRLGENRFGVPGDDGETTLLQWQFVF